MSTMEMPLLCPKLSYILLHAREVVEADDLDTAVLLLVPDFGTLDYLCICLRFRVCQRSLLTRISNTEGQSKISWTLNFTTTVTQLRKIVLTNE